MGPQLEEELCVDGCGKQRSVGGGQRTVGLGTEEKGERLSENEEPVVLGCSNVLVGPLALIVPLAAQSVTASIKLAYSFCQPDGRRRSICKDSKHNSGSFCEETIKVLAGVFVVA